MSLAKGAKMAKTVDEVSGGAVGQNEAMVRLQRIPNVGPRMASALLKLGIARLQDAAGKDPDEMYHELCAIDAKRHDPCVRDIFAAVLRILPGSGWAPLGDRLES
jgi:Pathogenicity locus